MGLTRRCVVAFEDGDAVTLGPDNHLTRPAHRRHPVAWMAPDEPTVGLAINIMDTRGRRRSGSTPSNWTEKPLPCSFSVH